MAKSFEGIFGGIFDQNVHLRDSRHAANAYGFNKADLSNGTPRHKFEFFVRINFNRTPEVQRFVQTFLSENDKDIVHTMVKNVTMPSMQIETETLNQYNKKRISQSRIDYNPVSITFHDSVEGRTLRLWEMYYEYYFKDGVAAEKLGRGGGSTPTTFLGAFFDAFANGGGRDAPKRNAMEYQNDIITDRFNDNHGYNLARVGNNKYLIDSIEIFQIHGGKFSRTEIVHPRVTAFNHDTLDYEDSSGLVEMKFDFAYEGVVYANVNERLNDDELERFRYGDFYELANLITIRTPIKGRKISNTAPLPNVACGVGTNTDAFGSATNNFLSSPLGTVVSGVIGQTNVQRVQDSIGGVIGSIPNAIGTVAAASIFGGTVSFNPDPIQALRTTANQVGRSVFGRTQGRFAAGVTAGVSTIASGITKPGGGTTQPGGG